ncbi:MAG: prepilin-type N-terminal cleavage/methylation domain-containing protein [Thermodesulfovibrionales bacterium]
MEGKRLHTLYYNNQNKIMMKREDGFTLVELMITMVVFVLFMSAASTVFTGLLTQFKQQSKQAETNIEGIVGLEILRQDIEGAGYGLAWNGLIAYSEVTANPFSLNDAPSGVPKAIVSKNSATSADYLVIRSVTVARNAASDKWTTLGSASPYVRTWTTAGETNPVSENLQSTDRVIVISPMGTSSNPRELIVDGSAFSTTFSGVTASSWRPTPSAVEETRVVYGIAPGSTNLRMPFNRADYFISTTNELGNNIVPKRCAPNTGVLVKATVNHSNGTFTYLPLLDCVADMQVIYGLDRDADGDFEPDVSGSTDGYNDDLTGSTWTAQIIHEQVKQVRVYILAHEGQKDITFIYPTSTVSLGGDVAGGLGSTFNLASAIGDPEYKHYRWKLYTIVVTPNNLE